jgi:ribonuclease T1
VGNKVVKLVLAGLLIVVAAGFGSTFSKEPLPRVYSDTLSVELLPPQGRETYRLILQGGPFPFDKDGDVFGNRERLLPLEKRGYYREYTVKTPEASNRGVRRIVCGGAPKAPEACYYTADHYASFRKIVP